MQVEDVMTRGVEVIASNFTIVDASKKMRDLNVGVLPVSQDDHIIGLITDRDILIRAVAEERNPENTVVKEIMSVTVYSCNEQSELSDVARFMEQKKVRRLLVQDNSGNVTGIVSLGDMAMFASDDLTGHILQKISKN